MALMAARWPGEQIEKGGGIEPTNERTNNLHKRGARGSSEGRQISALLNPGEAEDVSAAVHVQYDRSTSVAYLVDWDSTKS